MQTKQRYLTTSIFNRLFDEAFCSKKYLCWPFQNVHFGKYLSPISRYLLYLKIQIFFLMKLRKKLRVQVHVYVHVHFEISILFWNIWIYTLWKNSLPKVAYTFFFFLCQVYKSTLDLEIKIQTQQRYQIISTSKYSLQRYFQLKKYEY